MQEVEVEGNKVVTGFYRQPFGYSTRNSDYYAWDVSSSVAAAVTGNDGVERAPRRFAHSKFIPAVTQLMVAEFRAVVVKASASDIKEKAPAANEPQL